MIEPSPPPGPPYGGYAGQGTLPFPDQRPVAPPPADLRTERVLQARAAAILLGVLAVLGALLGLVWQAWSPPGPAGIELPKGIQADETEAFAAGDGRFALIVVVVGLLAGFAAWYVPLLRRARGPWIAAALAVGCVGGAALTEWVGYLVRGSGPTYTCGSDGSFTCIQHLPLTVHMHALLLVGAVAALLVYLLFAAFAVADDLGRADPVRGYASTPLPPPPPAFTSPPVGTPSVGTPSVGAPSVGAQGDPQYGGRHGDGAGGA